MKTLAPTEAQIRRIAELGGVLEAGATKEEAKKLIASLPTKGMLEYIIDEGGIPYVGITREEAALLIEKLQDDPISTKAEMHSLYGNTPPHWSLLKRLTEYCGYVNHGEISSGEASEIIASLVTKGLADDIVDAGGIPFVGITKIEADRLLEKLRVDPISTRAELISLYGNKPAHSSLLEWLTKFGYVLHGEITAGEAAEVIQTTEYEVDYLGFENYSLFGDDTDEKNQVAVAMRKLRKSGFPEWAYRKREIINKHIRLMEARGAALQPSKAHIETLKKKIETEHGTLPKEWWKLLEGNDRYVTFFKLRNHEGDVANLNAISETHESERALFWMAFTGVDMTEWTLGFDFGDIPRLAEKLARDVPRMKPATEAQVAAMISALDAEQVDWELQNPAQKFFAIRQKFFEQKHLHTASTVESGLRMFPSRMRPPLTDCS